MKKLVITLCTLFFSIHCYAAQQNLTSIMVNTLKDHDNSGQPNVPTIIYGGQDFSHSQIAIADGPTWSEKAQTWVG